MLLACFVAFALRFSVEAHAAPATESLTALVRADWELQEKRLGRGADSPEAIQSALQRARLLLADLGRASGIDNLTQSAAELNRLESSARNTGALEAAARLQLYFEIRAFTRRLALKNPLVASRPIAFMERRRAVGYMLYEYLGWYYAFGNDPTSGFKNPKFPTPPPGGGLFVLEEPGQSLRTRELTAGLLPAGHLVTLARSPDAQKLYFAFANPQGTDSYTLPGYAMAAAPAGATCNSFHIFSLNADGSGLRQLTFGPHDDFDPCPLPDGGIAFMSTRRGSKLRCGGGSPEMAYTLHRMDAEGGNVRTLSFHETHEWHPSVLHDGRIIYTRWDYVDRNAAKFHGLWTCNPDGSHPAVLFGNYTTRPWACFQAKPIPNSSRIAFIAGGHHANVGGTLMILDPARLGYDAASGEDRSEALECLTPEVPFAEAQSWPKSFFYSPWPLSENYFLIAFSHDPLPGGYTGRQHDSETGLYYFDRFGNLELLFRREGISAVYPMPLERAAASTFQASQGEESPLEQGEFLLADARRSTLPLPAGRRITELRVFQLMPKSRTDNADYPRMGHPEQANARMLLGTVPVEADGSAYFQAPARKPLYFQAVDQSGRAVQGMRSIVYLQSGERRGCVGCHEPPGATPPPGKVLATRRPPSVLQPGPDGSKPFGYARLIQPLLDQHCVRCHDGSAGRDKSPLVLTGQATERFNHSFDNLKPYLRWPSYDEVTRPGKLGADTSPLAAILTNEAHQKYAPLPAAALRTFYLWLDAQVPFYGTYEESDLAAQRRGQAVPVPLLE